MDATHGLAAILRDARPDSASALPVERAPQDEARAAYYFIGQVASATAAWGGKMGTNFPPVYCSSTRSAPLVRPVSSNFSRLHRLLSPSPPTSQPPSPPPLSPLLPT